MKVLVIEDNEQNLYLVRVLLEARGHCITEARSGPEGIAAAQATVPDLILLDIQLPHMDGYAVARALRAMPTLDAAPIIAVTSYAMSADRAKALAAGCDAQIVKPIDAERFGAEVEATVAVGRGKRGNAS